MALRENYQGFNTNDSKFILPRSLSITPRMESNKLVLIMVGLPARGKSYIAGKICNFFCWRGHNCRVFNVGHYRRKKERKDKVKGEKLFDSGDKNATATRHKLAAEVMGEAINWIKKSDGQIAIFDATNTTKERRKILVNLIREENYRFLFVETICYKEDTINENLRIKVERSPDFIGVPAEKAFNALRTRISHYEKVYEPVEDSEGHGYIKLIDMGTKLVSHKLNGYISRLLMVFLMNLNINKKTVFLTRAGNCECDNVDSKCLATNFKSRDSSLSDEGVTFSMRLAEFIKKRDLNGLQIWSSPLKRAVQTAQFIKIDYVKTKDDYQTNPDADGDEVAIFTTPNLKMVHQGVCYGMKPSTIKETHNDLYQQWIKEPLTYCFPGGESYMDAVKRVETMVIDLEQISSPVLIITHISILRILYAYMKSIPVNDIAKISFPQGLVIEFSPTLYGWREERHDLMKGRRSKAVEDVLNLDLDEIPMDNDIFKES